MFPAAEPYVFIAKTVCFCTGKRTARTGKTWKEAASFSIMPRTLIKHA